MSDQERTAGDGSGERRSEARGGSGDLPETDAEWRERLTPDQYRILRERGTEPRFSGDDLKQTADGTYACAGCGAELFDSETKYDSNSGWPSFYDAAEGSVELRRDTSHGMVRTEVVCANCGGHLGHVFDDGPEPTGKRYCINSAALGFDEQEGEGAGGEAAADAGAEE